MCSAYMCDVGRWPEWAPTVLQCWVRGGGPLAAWSWVDQRAKDLGRRHPRSQVVTVVQAPRLVAFAGTMGPSVARWGMQLEPVDDGQTDAMMWIEVDVAGIMRMAPGLFKGSIQRVSDREMAAIKTAVESPAGKPRSPRRGHHAVTDGIADAGGGWVGWRDRDATEIEEHTVNQSDPTRERLIKVYRKKAKHYDITSRLYPTPGYPQRAQRLRAVQALDLRPGDQRDRHRLRHRSELPADRGDDRSRRPDHRRRSDRRDAHPSPASHRHQRLAQHQPRASRRGRLRLPHRGRRDPVHLRPDPGARLRRGHRPRRRSPAPEADAASCSTSKSPTTRPAG